MYITVTPPRGQAICADEVDLHLGGSRAQVLGSGSDAQALRAAARSARQGFPIHVAGVLTSSPASPTPAIDEDDDDTLSQHLSAATAYSHTKKRSRSQKFFDRRIHDINALLRHRHNGPCDTDDGPVWFDAIVDHMAMRAILNHLPHRIFREQVEEWAKWQAPLLVREAGLSWIAAEADGYADRFASGTKWAAPKGRVLGDELRLTGRERDTLGITTIAAFDRTPEEVAALRRERDRDRKAAKRLRAGSVPRASSMEALHKAGLLGSGSLRSFKRLPKVERDRLLHLARSA